MPANYGAAVEGVSNLVPTVKLTSTSAVSEDTVREWLVTFTAKVAARLGNYAALPADEVGEVNADAKDLVELAVASRTFDAFHPTGQRPTADGYGAVLWSRYTSGLDELVADVAARLARLAAGDPAGPRPAGHFPRPLIARDRRY